MPVCGNNQEVGVMWITTEDLTWYTEKFVVNMWDTNNPIVSHKIEF